MSLSEIVTKPAILYAQIAEQNGEASGRPYPGEGITTTIMCGLLNFDDVCQD